MMSFRQLNRKTLSNKFSLLSDIRLQKIKMNNTKILIVDDSASMRQMLRVTLKDASFNIIGELASGNQLVATIERLRPDIVCLDYNLPDVDGITLLKEIVGKFPTLPVVMITGAIEPDLEMTAANAGAAGFLVKPFSSESIVKEISAVANARLMLKEAIQTDSTDDENLTPRATAVIADDNAIIRQLLKLILTSLNIKVVGEAADGKSAIELVQTLKPQLICLDLNMPEMGGMQALPQIKRACPEIKVLVISSEHDRATIIESIKAGASGYILKPFNAVKVIETVSKCLPDNEIVS